MQWLINSQRGTMLKILSIQHRSAGPNVWTSTNSKIGNELVPSAMLQVRCRFWPTMLQVSSGTLKFRVYWAKARQCGLSKIAQSTAGLAAAMAGRRALDQNIASRLAKDIHMFLTGVKSASRTCRLLVLMCMLLKQGERIWAVPYARTNADASTVKAHASAKKTAQRH